MRPALYSSGATAGPPPVAVVPRDPLPPFDPDSVDAETGAPLPVYTVLREPPPPKEVGWWRGNAWGITIPDLPLVPGGATGPAQTRVLTYFLDRYGRAFEDRIIEEHLRRGYTHISISPQDSFSVGTSEDAYVAMAERCARAGLFVHHLMRSKYYTPKPPDLPAMDALIDRLLDRGAMHVETPAWEMNHWDPPTVRAMIDHDAAFIGHRCRIMLHFFPHYISWQANDESPTDFWRANYGKVDGILYQCDPSWTAGMMAARATDGLDRLAPGGLWGLSESGRGHPIWYVGWETVATKQYNNDRDGDGRVSDEETGDLKGYEFQCAPGRMVVRGYGNGGRLPDGWAL
jgi:hypothetical protein